MSNPTEIFMRLNEIKRTFPEFEALKKDTVDGLFLTCEPFSQAHYMWRASEIATLIGYENKFRLNECIEDSFKNTHLYKIFVDEYCIPMPIEENCRYRNDYLLTRYGCHLTMLHIDPTANTSGLREYLNKLMIVVSYGIDMNVPLDKEEKPQSEIKDLSNFYKRITFNQF